MAEASIAMGGGLQQLRTLMRQQLAMQKQILEQQFELQREHMNEQLQLQQLHMQQLDLLSAQVATGQASPSDAPKTEALVEEKKPALGSNVPTEVSHANDINKAKTTCELWTRCSGLETIEDWAINYKKHPAGWGALLMIHGIPEVTGRLRVKVQNYAVFAGLFLAGTIKAMSGKPPVCLDAPDSIACEIRKRVYTYFFSITIASHILCILLAMAFHNALNEAARDSDVFRMFARGQGFVATKRCQMAFRVGAASTCIALAVVSQEHVGWDFLIWALFLATIVIVILRKTEGLLFRSASIVDYWRTELGGKPDANDPYDLTVPLDTFLKRAHADKSIKWGEKESTLEMVTI